MFERGLRCTRCVEGKGDRLFATSDVDVGEPPTVALPGGQNPLSLTFLVVSLSVLAQAVCFVTVGPLGDIGRFRKKVSAGHSTRWRARRGGAQG